MIGIKTKWLASKISIIIEHIWGYNGEDGLCCALRCNHTCQVSHLVQFVIQAIAEGVTLDILPNLFFSHSNTSLMIMQRRHSSYTRRS